MNKENRKKRVNQLFKEIALISELYKNDIQIRDKLIKPLSEELWTITKKQLELGELDHLHKGD